MKEQLFTGSFWGKPVVIHRCKKTYPIFSSKDYIFLIQEIRLYEKGSERALGDAI